MFFCPFNDRQIREREKGVKDKLKIAGTMLGNIMGVKEEEKDDEQKVREEAERAAPGVLSNLSL
jgi:hypothetical protein